MFDKPLNEDDRQARVLVIEDTASLRMTYLSILRGAGYQVCSAATAGCALKMFRAERPEAVLLDLVLPDRNGLDLIRDILAEAPGTPVVAVTAHGSINRAVEAMRAGAHEFLVKPMTSEALLEAVSRALPRPAGTLAHPSDAALAQPLPPFLGLSAPMQEIYRLVRSVARSVATVFITGESGTGKELCAEAVHRLSPRNGAPFIALNCGAIPADLLESEVFGHLKGSFTGAIAEKIGAAAAADGGTLFLDEICEMDLNLQTKLLRFLQSSTITPVGATRARKVDVRIICATNRNPEEEVRLGRFREDLFYRLHVVPIHLPPLRERGEDVVEIAEELLIRMAQEDGRSLRTIDRQVAELFRAFHWPGNVRQLINVLRQAVVLHDGPTLLPQMLPAALRRGVAPRDAAVAPQAPPPGLAPQLPEQLRGLTLAQIERMAVSAAVARNGGSVPRAARELDVSPSTLYRKRALWGDDG